MRLWKYGMMHTGPEETDSETSVLFECELSGFTICPRNILYFPCITDASSLLYLMFTFYLRFSKKTSLCVYEHVYSSADRFFIWWSSKVKTKEAREIKSLSGSWLLNLDMCCGLAIFSLDMRQLGIQVFYWVTHIFKNLIIYCYAFGRRFYLSWLTSKAEFKPIINVSC